MEVKFEENLTGCKSAAKKATEGSHVLKDAVLMEYKTEDGTIGKIRAPIEGVVSYTRSLQRGTILTKGTTIATVSECTHAIVIKDMCGTCGRDLREKGGRAGQRKEHSTANVSMIHHVPELIVSDSLAKELGSADEGNLIANRKLVLLVDLDQTIIHTSNLPIKIDNEKHPDVTKYTLLNGVYTTKLRPYTTEFLNKMSKIYEMHIVTYGQRQYAHRIAQILDPDERLFGHRILSRDELFSAQHKTMNLKALFPCGDNLIVIIDDRADVWKYSEALIQLKPYRFFKEVGDINAPKDSKDEQLPAVLIDDEGIEDRVLEEIERVLTNIHHKYYEMYDMKSPNEPLLDVKKIINEERRKVLDGCVIVLSGVVPLKEKVEKTDIYRLCLQFGAKVVPQVTDEVTHVVAALWGTNKVHMAIKMGIHVVTVKWVYACVEKWLKADEKLYELTKESTPPSGKPLGSKLINDLATISTIGKSALADMNNEVDEALSDDEEGEDEEDNDEEEEDLEVELEEDEVMEEVREEDQRKEKKKEEVKGSGGSGGRKRKHAPEEEYETDSDEEEEEEDGAPMSYKKLLSRSKKQGRMVAAGYDEQDEVFDVDDEKGHVAPGDEEDEEEESDDGNDDDEEDFEDMAAMIERQVSGGDE